MSSLDGVKTASAFQHDFRAVLAKAKNLKARIDNGDVFKPVPPATKRGTYCCVVFLRLLHLHCCQVVVACSHLLRPPRQLQRLMTERSSHILDIAIHSAFLRYPFNLRVPIRTQPALQSSVNMGKTTDAPSGGQKMIPADCVSVLLMALGCTSITREQLNIMSALDGTRTASSFEHQFRSISAKAKELKQRVDKGEKFAPVSPTQKRGVQWLR